MPGLDMVMGIAKDALAAQQYGITVTGHNIANVNTEGYSRQSPVFEAKVLPVLYEGMLFGRGVDISKIIRTSDQFIETQLTEKRSSLLSSKEMENYMQALEGLFNENSETGISTLLAEFWNSWHDVANNPSGSSERIVLYEHSIFLSEQFKTLDTDLTQLETELTNAISAAINEINLITNEIAELNGQIPKLETNSLISNDLRDKRNILVSQLGEYVDVKTFEQSNGSLTVISAKGCVMVNEISGYSLRLNGDAVKWEGSGDNTIDITDYLTNGKLGGWLDMRDEIIAKYKLDLDAVAEEFIWAVNQQHSQGVGLEGFSSLTGTYAASNAGAAMGTSASGLDFYDSITDGSFKLWLYDSNEVLVGSTTINIVANTTTLTSLANTIDTAVIGGADVLDGTVTSGKLQIDVDTGYTFAFSDDTSNILAALGVNTFFDGTGSGSIDVNAVINDKDYIAAARIDASGNYATGDNTNALSMADLQYSDLTIKQWTCVRGQADTSEDVNSVTLEDYFHSMVSSIGVKSASISRGRAFNEVMVEKLTMVRDSISAVSLDEEMTNLIKYAQGYAAAAKLISVADEMLTTLLSIK